MSFRDLIIILLRRWYVVLLVLMFGAAATYVLVQDDGVYTTRTAITFRYPDATPLERYNGAGDKSVISFASLIALEINDGKPPATYASDSAPYYGAGVRQGVLVGLPNEGNQWIPMYREAQIDIQVVGPSEHWVNTTRNRLVARVLELADRRQRQAGVPAAERIAPTVEPLTLQIGRVSPSRKTQMLGITALFAATCLVGAWSAVTVDTLLQGRALRRRDMQLPANLRSEGAVP